MTLDPQFDVNLPKWPQLLITGKTVTVEQAKGIIFATDTFLTSLAEDGGNSRQWQRSIADRMGLATTTVIGIFHLKSGTSYGNFKKSGITTPNACIRSISITNGERRLLFSDPMVGAARLETFTTEITLVSGLTRAMCTMIW